jgi:chromate transporter
LLALIYLLVVGGGRWSVDALLSSHKSPGPKVIDVRAREQEPGVPHHVGPGAVSGESTSARPTKPGVGEVFRAFLKLGVTSFGGPIAHLGYFHEEFVARRRWIDEQGYADLVALCQFLPGPASSKVGFSLGLLRGGGLLGGLAAWTAFTLPSASLLLAFAYGASWFTGPIGSGAIHGLKVVAVAVVAQAVWGMAFTLAPDRTRATIALVAALLIAGFAGGSSAQIAAIVLGAFAGLVFCRAAPAKMGGHFTFPISRRLAIAALIIFFALLFLLPVVVHVSGSQGAALFNAFFRSGALVFGGGHVVLPLLRAEFVAPGWVTADTFLAGYGAAQAIPGPLFTFATYLGAVTKLPPNGIAGAAIGLVAIFLPGMLILCGTLPFWDALRTRSLAQAAMRGTNAAVVGILGAALYDPLWTTAILNPRDFALALTAFVLLTAWKSPPWVVVAITAAGGAALGLL